MPAQTTRKYTKRKAAKNTEIQEGEREPNFYKCCRCGQHFKKLHGNFPSCQSEIYAGLDYHLPICRECLRELFEHYIVVYGGNERLALRRICEMFDLYYSEILVQASAKTRDKTNSRMYAYIKAMNLQQYRGKTFDTTLEEERANNIVFEEVQEVEEEKDVKEYKVTPKMLRFWGTGYKVETLQTLQGYYDELLKLCESKPDIKQQKIMKNLCLLEYQMQTNIQNGKDIGTLSNSYKSMFEASGLKAEETDLSNDTLGKWIAEIEKYSPAEYYADKTKYHDFFGIGEYIERFMFRPLRNLIFGTKEKEKEFWIEDEEDSNNTQSVIHETHNEENADEGDGGDT